MASERFELRSLYVCFTMLWLLSDMHMNFIIFEVMHQNLKEIKNAFSSRVIIEQCCLQLSINYNLQNLLSIT